jgi:hypothetical protein
MGLLAEALLARYAGVMNNERLLETLHQLHVELSQTERVDSEVLTRLRAVTDDIERALDQHGATSAAELEPASSGLKDLLLRFEAEHPQLSVAVGRVADALAAMGI